MAKKRNNKNWAYMTESEIKQNALDTLAIAKAQNKPVKYLKRNEKSKK